MAPKKGGKADAAPKADAGEAPKAAAAKNVAKPAPKKVEKAAEKTKKVPGKAIMKAMKTKKRVLKGGKGTRVVKVRTSCKFSRPETLQLPKNPKYPK